MTVPVTKLQLLRINEALQALDGGYEDGNGRKKPFLWKEGGKVRFHTYRLMKRVEDLVESINKARGALLDQLKAEQSAEGIESPAPESPLVPKYLIRFNKQYTSLLEESESLEVRPFSVDLLDLDKNPVPCSILAILEGRLFEATETN